jgi:hypothetical protein
LAPSSIAHSPDAILAIAGQRAPKALKKDLGGIQKPLVDFMEEEWPEEDFEEEEEEEEDWGAEEEEWEEEEIEEEEWDEEEIEEEE